MPIKVEELNTFHQLLQPHATANHDNVMLWAAICLAYFGFLRVSEFTIKQRFQGSTDLSTNDITFIRSLATASSVKVFIKASKADPFRQGTKIGIGRTESNICAVTALKRYFQVCKPEYGPFFKYKSGENLTARRFTQEIRALLSQAGKNSLHYAGHSFCIGAATSAASANVQLWLIKSMGRWSSDCFERYIHTSDDVLFDASKQLVKC